MKQRMQGVVIGALVMVLLLGTVTVFAATTRTIEVTFGNFRTYLFAQEFVARNAQGEILQPFMYEGSLYLPAEAVLHAMGENASWDTSTGVFRFGRIDQPPVVRERVPLNTAAPHFDTTHRFTQGFNVGVTPSITTGNAAMGGVTYNDTLTFATRSGSMAHNPPTIAEMSTLHNLGGNFNRLTGYIGRIDGSVSVGATLRIYGDGNLLTTYQLNALDMPTELLLSTHKRVKKNRLLSTNSKYRV